MSTIKVRIGPTMVTAGNTSPLLATTSMDG
jgi:hypothetical protein